MLKDRLTDKIKACTSTPGTFRAEDLNILFDSCSQKLQDLLRLQDEERNLLREKRYLEEREKMEVVGEKTKQIEKIKAKKTKSEYKYKCEYRSCGKIMLSEASYLTHMKKHERKERGDHL